MKTLILALSLASVPAFADTATPGPLEVAVRHERSAGARVEYYAKLAIIAERDRVTAQITIEMAKTEWDAALRANDAKTAAYWAKRYHGALADARKAELQALLYRTSRDAAREDFEASAAEVRRHRERG
jgi:hypothetical protein